MKKLFCVITLAVLAISASAQKIFMGEAKENQLLLADPFILEDDGWYYIYGTHAADGIVVYQFQIADAAAGKGFYHITAYTAQTKYCHPGVIQFFHSGVTQQQSGTGKGLHSITPYII